MFYRTHIDKVSYGGQYENVFEVTLLDNAMKTNANVRTIKEIGLLAREKRRELGWTQQDLAEKIGSQKKWVVEFEAGKPTIGAGRMMLAINILGLELSLGNAPDPKKNQGLTAASLRSFDAIFSKTKS